MNHSVEVREAVVRKAAVRTAPQREIAREFGVSVTTVQTGTRNAGVARRATGHQPAPVTSIVRRIKQGRQHGD